MNDAPLVIGLLGMPDNERTIGLLENLACEGIEVDFVIYWRTGWRDNLKRLYRKLRVAGLRPAIERATYALSSRRDKPPTGAKPDNPGYRSYYVPSHNSDECLQILAAERVDILLLATDTILARRVLMVPKLATLNAHPGWIPTFRGLSSNLYQMKAGKLPAVSVHQVDEGIDTGPLIVRQVLDVDSTQGLRGILASVPQLQAKLLAHAVRMYQHGTVSFIDTFGEPSNMTRGMSPQHRKTLDQRMRQGRQNLTDFEVSS
jgi:hypothetical protein